MELSYVFVTRETDRRSPVELGFAFRQLNGALHSSLKGFRLRPNDGPPHDMIASVHKIDNMLRPGYHPLVGHHRVEKQMNGAQPRKCLRSV